jgi:hypothetical protein
MSDDCRRIAAFAENGRKYHAENPEERKVVRCHIDGCAIRDGERCDYALYVPDMDAVCFIELKGKDLKKAIQQISSTLTQLGGSTGSCIVHARIVLSRVSRPDVNSSYEIQLQRSLAQRGGKLKRDTTIMTENIEKDYARVSPKL